MATQTDERPVVPSEPNADKLPEELFALGDGGLTNDQRENAMGVLTEFLTDATKNFLGYQVNDSLRQEGLELATFLQMHTNNIGDPFTDATLRSHTKPLERAVLAYYANLWGLDPHNPEDLDTAWGYVLTMGSSEGNVYGLMSARDYLSGLKIMHPHAVGLTASAGTPEIALVRSEPPPEKPNYFTPVIFFSEDAHYSVAKAAHVLRIPTFGEFANANDEYRRAWPPEGWPYAVKPGDPWPHEVPSERAEDGSPDGPGSIDVEALTSLVRFFAEKGHPILIVLNLGSTFKGAYDDVEGVADAIAPILDEWGLRSRHIDEGDDRQGFWLHVDGALGASYVPFLREAQGADTQVPKFDFEIPEVSSIVTSGHKYPGCPWPCGIYMTRQQLQITPPPTPDYISAPDTTFGGSRNAFSAIFLWDSIARHDRDAQRKMIMRCQDLAASAVEQLKATLEPQLKGLHKDDLHLKRTPHSLCIRFRKPHKDIVNKYSLASVTVPVPGSNEVIDYTHVYVMPHVTQERIDDLIRDLMHKDAFPDSARRTPEQAGVAAADVMHPGDAGVIAKFALNRGLAY